MPLVSSILNTELVKVMDNDNPTFVGFPADNNVMAGNWSSGINAYASAVVPPSTTSSAAETAMLGVLVGMDLVSGLPTFISAFTTYATQLALGMLPTFTGTPPPVPIDFSSVFSLPFETPIAARISAMAVIIDTWFRTGIAVPTAGGGPVPWS